MLSTACAESANHYGPLAGPIISTSVLNTTIACLSNFINGIVGFIGAQPATAGGVSRPVRPTVFQRHYALCLPSG
jgi:hypothetical protein